ncbi:MAG: hypothetical protein NTY98_21690 [Verrucomicrobia bacterium]|nr:hypothetical protein [Verrucomicrobiota bacterium]
MAQDSHPSPSADELIAEITRNREVLAEHRAALHRTTHVGSRLQQTYHDHAGLFLGSAAVSGLLLSYLPSSRKSRRESRARLRADAATESVKKIESRSLTAVLLGLLGKMALDMGKPMLLKMVRDHYLRAAHAPSAARPPETNAPAP